MDERLAGAKEMIDRGAVSIRGLAKLARVNHESLRQAIYGDSRFRDPDAPDRIQRALRDWETGQRHESRPIGETPGRGRRPFSLIFGALFMIPVVGSVSAGANLVSVDSDRNGVWVPAPLAKAGDLGLVVQGDSMEPKLKPGDVAIFKSDPERREHYATLVRKDDEYRVKLMKKIEGRWMLVSLNEEYPPVDERDYEILGYLVGWYRVKGTRETMDSDPTGLRLDH